MPASVLLGSYRRAGKVLAIFGSLSRKSVSFRLSFDRSRLNLGAAYAPFDAETGKALPNGVVEIEPYDVKLVIIE